MSGSESFFNQYLLALVEAIGALLLI